MQTNHRGVLTAFIVATFLTACGQTEKASNENATTVEHLFVGGLLFDGSGSAPYVGDIGVSDQNIVFVGDAAEANVTSPDTIDATGMWVAPGFIDAHSHAELDPDYGRDALPYLHQGITTVVLGTDGDGTSNVADRLQRWRTNGIGTNGILYVGHGYIRRQVMGDENRAPTTDEMTAMQGLI